MEKQKKTNPSIIKINIHAISIFTSNKALHITCNSYILGHCCTLRHKISYYISYSSCLKYKTPLDSNVSQTNKNSKNDPTRKQQKIICILLQLLAFNFEISCNNIKFN